MYSMGALKRGSKNSRNVQGSDQTHARYTSTWYVTDSRIIIFLQANIVFIPKDNSYKRHDRHAVEKKSNEDDDDEDIERPAVLRTRAWRSLTIFNTLTVEELLPPSVLNVNSEKLLCKGVFPLRLRVEALSLATQRKAANAQP